jgi:hypothetical protein
MTAEELISRGQEASVVRLNFVFFTDSVSELYGQRMYDLKTDTFSKRLNQTTSTPGIIYSTQTIYAF